MRLRFLSTVSARLAAGMLLASAPCLAHAADATDEAAKPTYQVNAAYTGESWHVVDGGLAHGSSYLDNGDLQAQVDGGRTLGVDGLTFYGYLLWNNGHEFAGPYAAAAQGVSNIEAVRAWRVFEAWAEVALGGESSLRFGLYNLNSEFDVNETGGLFLNPAHGIGSDFAQSGENGPSIFPVTSLALRWATQFGGWQVRAAMLDGVPGDPEDASRTHIHLGGGDGALLVGESGRELGEHGRFALGAWHYTGRFDDVLALDANGDPERRRGNTGLYGIVEGRVYGETDPDQGLSLFLRGGVADTKVNRFGSYLGVGAVYTGLLPGRPVDQLGLAIATARNGSRWRDAQTLAALATEAYESNVELTYRLQLGDRFYLQPNLQYIVNPETDPAIQNTWAVGLRFRAAWEWSR